MRTVTHNAAKANDTIPPPPPEPDATTRRKSLRERYEDAFATVITDGSHWPPPADHVINFCARINDLCSHLAWDLANGEERINPIAMQDLLRLSRELLLVAADDVELRSSEVAS